MTIDDIEYPVTMFGDQGPDRYTGYSRPGKGGRYFVIEWKAEDGRYERNIYEAACEGAELTLNHTERFKSRQPMVSDMVSVTATPPTPDPVLDDAVKLLRSMQTAAARVAPVVENVEVPVCETCARSKGCVSECGRTITPAVIKFTAERREDPTGISVCCPECRAVYYVNKKQHD